VVVPENPQLRICSVAQEVRYCGLVSLWCRFQGYTTVPPGVDDGPTEAAMPTRLSSAHPMACYCFDLCPRTSTARFWASTRGVSIQDAHSPWTAYFGAVYGEEVPLPFPLSNITFFYHNSMLWRQLFPSVHNPFRSCDTPVPSERHVTPLCGTADVSALPVAKVRTSRAPRAARAALITSRSRIPVPRRYSFCLDDSRARSWRSWRRRSTHGTHRADGNLLRPGTLSNAFEGKRCQHSPFPPPAARDQLHGACCYLPSCLFAPRASVVRK